jgi:toxin ParE1/3/4
VKPVIVHPLARTEWDKGIAYYEAQTPGLGLDFLAKVEEAFLKIQQHPQMWPPHTDPRFRKYVLERFPYLIFYWEQTDNIWIVAIAHAKRRPDFWMRRNQPR